MSHKYSGGCDHIHTHPDNDPIDNHTCHCSACKGVTVQGTSHVVFFNHGDLAVDSHDGLNHQPFNTQNPDGPLELCTCADCGTPIMLDDKESRIRVIVLNLMGYDPASGALAPDDGRPVHKGLALILSGQSPPKSVHMIELR